MIKKTFKVLLAMVLLLIFVMPIITRSEDLPSGGWWLNSSQVPGKYQEAIPVIQAYLSGHGEDTSAFYVTAEEPTSFHLVIFHLWHKDAFKQQNTGILGNPGGKCRDLYYNHRTRKITKESFWR